MLNKLKAFIDNLEDISIHDISELWASYRKYLLLFGIIIIGFKFRNALAHWSLEAAERLYNKTIKNDKILNEEEQKAQNQANSLVKDAKDLGLKKSEPIQDEWYKKKQ